MDKLQDYFQTLFKDEPPVKAVFSARRSKKSENTKVVLRPVMISGRTLYQAEYHYKNKVIHRNMSYDDAASLCRLLLTDEFKQANIFTASSDIQILAAKAEDPRITKKPSALRCAEISHDRTKKYIIPDGKPCDFLIRLGVMDKSGRVIKKHYSKFRQINRYLEIVDDCLPYLLQNKKEPLRIIDFGCGKAYLTFAIYHYLKIIKNLDVKIVGLDLKKDVIEFCNKVADDLGYDGLSFMVGDIADYTNDHADMVVTLHACDTATDYALINAVKWKSSVILSVPCCQHELFSQIRNDLHQPMLKHGILKDRLTEYLTDGLRGLKLEECGYDVSMIEFTSLEHTSRNIMIKAVKRTGKTGSIENDIKSKKARSQYEALRDFYNVHPAIDVLNPPV